MRNILRVEADIKGQRRVPGYIVTQNDSVSIIVTVLDGGSPVNLDEVSTMTIACTRRDGRVVVKAGTQSGPSEITFELGTTEIELTGKVDAVVQLYSADGRVSTIKFAFNVTKDPTGEGYVPSEDERTLIEVVIGDGPLVIERAETAATFIEDKRPLIEKFTDEQTNLQAQLDEVARGATNAETSQARVDAKGESHPTLKARLDAEHTQVTAQLAQKANEAEVRKKVEKIELEDLSSTTLAAIEGGEGTSFNLLSIPQNDSVDPTKLEPKLRDGLTFPLKNLITNGSFEQLTTWSFSSHYIGSGHSGSSTDDSFVGSRSAKGVVAGQSPSAQCRDINAYAWKSGHKYYVLAYIKPKYNTKTTIELGNGSEAPSNFVDAGDLTPNTWNKISGIVDYKLTSTVPARFAINHSTAADTPYENGDVVYFDGFLAIDLTASFGAGHEPGIEEVNFLLSQTPGNWFDGETRIPFSLRHSLKINQLETQVQEELTLPLNNLVVNGNFLVAHPWSFSSHFTGEGYSLSTSEGGFKIGKSAKGVVAGSSEMAHIRGDDVFKWVQGHKYYLLSYIKPKYNTKTSMGIGDRDEAKANYLDFNNLTPNTWNKISGIVDYKLTSTVPARFAINHSTAADTPYENGDVVYFSGILAIDLTEIFGAGKEPGRDEVDLLIDELPYGWFDGEKRISLLSWQKNSLDFLRSKITNTPASDLNIPMFSFRFDDGHSTNYTEGFPRLRDAGMKGSYCLVPDWMDVPGRITTAQAIEMANAGHEILSHSLTHPRLPDITEEQLRSELIDSKVALENKIGREIKSFSVPQGDYGDREDIFCHSVYKNVTTSKNYTGVYNPYGKMKNFHSSFMETRDFAWVKERIDLTIENKGWLILGIHVLRDLPVEQLGALDTSIEVFEQTIAYIKSFMPDGAMVVTVDEGASIVRSRK